MVCTLFFFKSKAVPPPLTRSANWRAFPQQVQRPIFFNLFTKDDSSLGSLYFKELTGLKTKTVAVINPFVCVCVSRSDVIKDEDIESCAKRKTVCSTQLRQSTPLETRRTDRDLMNRQTGCQHTASPPRIECLKWMEKNEKEEEEEEEKNEASKKATWKNPLTSQYYEEQVKKKIVWNALMCRGVWGYAFRLVAWSHTMGSRRRRSYALISRKGLEFVFFFFFSSAFAASTHTPQCIQ